MLIKSAISLQVFPTTSRQPLVRCSWPWPTFSATLFFFHGSHSPHQMRQPTRSHVQRVRASRDRPAEVDRRRGGRAGAKAQEPAGGGPGKGEARDLRQAVALD